MEHYAKQHHMTSRDDWYEVTPSQIIYAGGASILNIYDGSLHAALCQIYPEHEWNSSKFHRNPRKIKVAYGYWRNKSNQEREISQLEKKLRITKFQDWYQISAEEVRRHGGSSLLSQFGGSLKKTLAAVRAQSPWNPLEFKHAPVTPPVSSGHWKDMTNQRNFFEKLAKQFNIKHWTDWYNVSREDIQRNGGSGLLNHYANSHLQALEAIFPEHPWRMERIGFWYLRTATQRAQRFLTSFLEDLFPGDPIKSNYDCRQMVSSGSGKNFL